MKEKEFDRNDNDSDQTVSFSFYEPRGIHPFLWTINGLLDDDERSLGLKPSLIYEQIDRTGKRAFAHHFAGIKEMIERASAL